MLVYMDYQQIKCELSLTFFKYSKFLIMNFKLTYVSFSRFYSKLKFLEIFLSVPVYPIVFFLKGANFLLCLW